MPKLSTHSMFLWKNFGKKRAFFFEIQILNPHNCKHTDQVDDAGTMPRKDAPPTKEEMAEAVEFEVGKMKKALMESLKDTLPATLAPVVRIEFEFVFLM